MTIAQLETWKPERLSTIADQLNTHRSKLVDLQDELDDGRPPTSWVGADSYYAEQKHAELGEQIVDDVAEIATVISALDTAATDIGSAKDSLDGALSAAHAAGFTVDKQSGMVRDPQEYDDELAAQHAGVRVNALAEQLGTALEDAAAADTALANALTKATSGTIDVDGDLGSLGLDALLRGKTPEEQATYLLDHPERGREILDALPPAVKKEIGEQMSELTDDIMDPNKDIDKDVLERLNEVQDAYGEDPTISTSFLDTMGPDRMVELNGWIADLQMDDDFPEDSSYYANQMDHGLAEQMGALQTNLGQILGAGTAGLDGDGQPGDRHPRVVRLGAAAGREGRRHRAVRLPGEDGQYQHQMYGYQLLAPMLHSADSGYLLNEVGDGMLRFETDFTRENGAPPWNFPIVDDDGVVRAGARTASTRRPSGTAYASTERRAPARATRPASTRWARCSTGSRTTRTRPATSSPATTSRSASATATTPRGATRAGWTTCSPTASGVPDHTNWSEVHRFEDHTGPSNDAYLGDALKAATLDDPTDGASREQVRDILEETVHSLAGDEQVSGHGNLDLG